MLDTLINEAGYRAGDIVLRDIAFRVSKGESILITGPSGSGKTTLLLALTGVLTNLLDGYLDGQVRIDGVDPISPDGFTYIPRYIGVVLQDPEKQLAMPKVLDEVLFTLENLGYEGDAAYEIAREYLEDMDLWSKRDSHVEDLSGGEKRRLTIASALAHNPMIILLDEVTASMDPWGISTIRRYIEGWRGEKTVIIVDHKARYFIDLVDKVYLLDSQLMEVEDPDILENYNIDIMLKKRIDRSPSKPGDKKLILENLSIGYGEPIQTGVSLEVRAGEVACIVGPNGIGKSTLLKTIAGFLNPFDGSIYVDGKVFYVPQAPDNLFMFRSVSRELREAIKKAGASQDITSRLVDLYRLRMDIPPFRLSHGQRRLLANIIASIYSRDIILFDEPSTGLDLNLYMEVVKQIRDLADGGRAILISSHDPRILLDICDKAYIMESGVEEVDVDDALKYLEDPVGGYEWG